MAFFNSAVGVLQTLVVALGAGLGIREWYPTFWKVTPGQPASNAHMVKKQQHKEIENSVPYLFPAKVEQCMKKCSLLIS